jgi:hypothetical protein
MVAEPLMEAIRETLKSILSRNFPKASLFLSNDDWKFYWFLCRNVETVWRFGHTSSSPEGPLAYLAPSFQSKGEFPFALERWSQIRQRSFQGYWYLEVWRQRRSLCSFLPETILCHVKSLNTSRSMKLVTLYFITIYFMERTDITDNSFS